MRREGNSPVPQKKKKKTLTIRDWCKRQYWVHGENIERFVNVNEIHLIKTLMKKKMVFSFAKYLQKLLMNTFRFICRKLNQAYVPGDRR